MKRLIIYALAITLVSFIFIAADSNKNDLPQEWKYNGKKMPILLQYEYNTTKGISFLHGFIRNISNYPEILAEKKRKMRERGISLTQLPPEQTEMYNELVDLTNKGVIGIRFFMFTDIVSGIELKPEQLLITFADGRSCPAVGLVYFNEDKTDTQLGKPLLIKRLAINKPLHLVTYIPESYKKPYSEYPAEKWVTRIIILPPEPQTAQR